MVMVAGSAFAYQSSREARASMVRVCKNYADTAELYLMMQEQGQRPNEHVTWMEPVRAHIESEIFNNPPGSYTRESARVMGYTHCMDNVESLTLDYQQGLN